MSVALRRHATQLAVRFDAFQLAANCARVTNKLFELEPAPLTLPKGIWIETETWLFTAVRGPSIRDSSNRTGNNLRQIAGDGIGFLQRLMLRTLNENTEICERGGKNKPLLLKISLAC
jgi:hypothetical protein